MKRKFCCYWFFVGWWAISLGAHVSFREPNLELHLPLGFVRVGWELLPRGERAYRHVRARRYGQIYGLRYEEYP